MNLLLKLIPLLLLMALYVPSYAAVNDLEFISCSVSNEGDKKTEEGDKKTGEEEPDCE